VQREKGGVVKKSVLVIAVTVAVCMGLAMAFAGIGVCQSGDTKAKEAAAVYSAPVKVNNTVCPVTGNPVNMKDPVTVEYNGKIYNLCCAMCPAVFKADPEKYSKIAEEQAAKK